MSIQLVSNDVRKKPKQLFTQICVAVLAVLFIAAILFPVQTQDRRKDRPIMCFSQLKQLGLAVQMYAADNDDGLPNRFTFGGENETSEFVNATQPYIKNYQILVCPEEVEAFKAASNPSPPPGAKHHMSYVHCLSLKGVIPDFNKGNRFFCPKTSNLELSQTPYMREPIESFGNPEGDQPGPALLSAHRHYPNISYLDGHVRGKTRLDINTQL